MQKLISGIIDFHQRVRPSYKESFAHLALGQSPDCLFIACSDSRVVPNLFASTDPGDLFVVRNVGNMVSPPAHPSAEGAAIEFATLALNVRDVVICGHSECGAMKALLSAERPRGAAHLDAWLSQGGPSLERLQEPGPGAELALHDRLSQRHVLQQIEHLRSYPSIREREERGEMGLHAWWFDIAEARVLAFSPKLGEFVPIVEHPEP